MMATEHGRALVAGVAILVVAAFVGWFLVGDARDGLSVPAGSPAPVPDRDPADPGATARSGPPEGPVTQRKSTRPDTPALRGFFTPAEARAYLWLGAREDGGDPPVLDPEAQESLSVMAPLLAAQPRTPGAGLPTVSRQGVQAIGEVDPAKRLRLEEFARRLRDGDTLPPEQICDLVDQVGTITRTAPGSHHLAGRGLWAVIRHQPGAPLHLVADPGADYCVRFEGPQIDRVRVDGGLVLPGRYYALGAGLSITSEVAVDVYIRPRTAVPAYHSAPLKVPQADA
jgi:hypothetical protein